MELKYLVVAGSAQQGSNDGINNFNVLIDPKASIALPFIPTTFSFVAFCAINGIPSEPGTFKIEIHFEDTPEDLLLTPLINITKEQIDEIKKSAQDIFLTLNLQNVVFKREGNLVFNVFYDEIQIGKEAYSIINKPQE